VFWGFGSFSPLLAQAKEQPADVQSITPYLKQFQQKITEFRLDNGLKFIILEISQCFGYFLCHLRGCGGADEPDGKTGVAHFLEHLAFKGTKTIGTTDYLSEKKVLDRLEAIDKELQAAKKAGKSAEVAKLTEEFQQAKAESEKFVQRNEYGQIVETQGGVGLNATTSSDATSYFYSFPSNKLELWMSLESERFLEPIFQREFYKEKDVILEEKTDADG
jgi:predicted Zn-dependent peptidase